MAAEEEDEVDAEVDEEEAVAAPAAAHPRGALPLFGGFAGCMVLDPALEWGDGRVRELGYDPSRKNAALA